MRCRGRPNRILMLGQPGLSGALMQNMGNGTCMKGTGNFRAPGRPGSGPKAVQGIVLNETTVQIRFTQCVNVATPGTCEIQIDGGAWTPCTNAVDAGAGKLWDFTVATINPGETVIWRYVSGSSGVVDCEESIDIGDQQVNVDNSLVLAGDFILLESGGMDIILLEDDVADTEGIQLEEALS